MAQLEMRGVKKGYGSGANRSLVLDDVNLSIEEGEFVAIVGYSGAGKTTLISMVSGLLAPDAGEVLMNGKAVTGPGRDRGVVFQNYSLLPWLTAHENLMLAVEQTLPAASRADKAAHAKRYLELVGLGAAGGKRPHELSGGMRQRVSLARALAMDPKVLLMDEPLGALDALTRATLQGEIERIWRADEKTVLLITNDVDEGILLADRIIPLEAGPAATLGPSFAVDLERPRDRKALNHDPRFKAIRSEVIEWLLAHGPKRRPVEQDTVERSAPVIGAGTAEVRA